METAVYQRAYPTKKMTADSLIYRFISQNGYDDFIIRNNLQPFELNVQTTERTMIDNLFALAAYYLLGPTSEHSRHIYDIFKLSEIVDIDETLKDLAVSVANERKPHKMSLSVQDGADIKNILKEIISKNIYKENYENITLPLLFETVSYEQAVAALSDILEKGLFNKI